MSPDSDGRVQKQSLTGKPLLIPLLPDKLIGFFSCIPSIMQFIPPGSLSGAYLVPAKKKIGTVPPSIGEKIRDIPNAPGSLNIMERPWAGWVSHGRGGAVLGVFASLM